MAHRRPQPIPVLKKVRQPLPSLSEEEKAAVVEFHTRREQKWLEEARQREEAAREEEKDQPKLRDELPWDVQCLIYKHLDYATLAKLAEHSVFPELQKCLREVVLNPTSEDENGRRTKVTIRLDFLEQFPRINKLSGPTYNNEDEDKQGQEWGVIKVDDFLTEKDVKFILGLEELAYVEFQLAKYDVVEGEDEWESSNVQKLLLGMLKKPADKFKFRIKLSVKETGEEYIWARYDGGIEYYLKEDDNPAMRGPDDMIRFFLLPLIPFAMRWYIDDIDVEGRKRTPVVKNHNILAHYEPDFVIGISKEYQAEHGRKHAVELRQKLQAKYPAHEVILEEWK